MKKFFQRWYKTDKEMPIVVYVLWIIILGLNVYCVFTLSDSKTLVPHWFYYSVYSFVILIFSSGIFVRTLTFFKKSKHKQNSNS